MKMMSAALLLSAIFVMAAAEECYAPAGSWGAICQADKLYTGQKGFYVNYHIIVLEKDAQVWCKGLGVSQFGPTASCAWQLWDLGKIDKEYVSLIWDNASAKPTIQCYGMNKSTKIQWTYTTGSSAMSCIR